MLEKVKYRRAIEKIAAAISEGKNITNFDLLEMCRQIGIGESASEGKIHLPHELLEVAVNDYISKLYCNYRKLGSDTAEFGAARTSLIHPDMETGES